MPIDIARVKIVERHLANNGDADDPSIVADLAIVESELVASLGPGHLLVENRDQLRRFIVARNGDTAAASEMIEAHMRWRAAALPVRLTAAVIAELKKGKIETYGKDINGNPLITVRSSRFDPKERDIDTATAAAIYLIECALANQPKDVKATVFYDRQDFSFRKNWDLEFIKAIIGTLSNNYPERLHAVYVYPASAILGGLFAIVKPFLNPRSRAKVRIVTSDKELLTLLPAEFVPVSAGGTCQHVFDPAVYDSLVPTKPAEAEVEVVAVS